MSEPTTQAGKALHKVDHGDPCTFRSCALVPAIRAIEAEAIEDCTCGTEEGKAVHRRLNARTLLTQPDEEGEPDRG